MTYFFGAEPLEVLVLRAMEQCPTGSDFNPYLLEVSPAFTPMVKLVFGAALSIHVDTESCEGTGSDDILELQGKFDNKDGN